MYKTAAYITKIGESKVTIEVCTGTKNEGNKGEEPEEPKFPIIVDDTLIMHIYLKINGHYMETMI